MNAEPNYKLLTISQLANLLRKKRAEVWDSLYLFEKYKRWESKIKFIRYYFKFN